MADPADLAETPFPLVLAHHFHRHSTGTLTVRTGPYVKRVYLKGGAAVFAASDDRNDRLGELLVRRDVLGLPDFLAASRSMVRGKRFGTVLVERGLLTPAQLVWAVKEQVKEIVFSLFPISGGSCHFTEGDAGEGEIITLAINTPELLRQGVARMDSANGALAAFPDPALRLRLHRPAEEVMGLFVLDPKEAQVLFALQAGPSVSDLCSGTRLRHFDLLKFLWALKILGLLAEAAGSLPASPRSSDASAATPEADPGDLGVTEEDLKDLI